MISADPGLNFTPCFFSLFKRIFLVNFCLLFFKSVQSSNCRQKKLNWYCVLSFHINLNTNFGLTLRYLNRALNNPALQVSYARSCSDPISPTHLSNPHRHWCLTEKTCAIQSASSLLVSLNREEKSLRHIPMVAKFLDLNKLWSNVNNEIV